MLKSGFSSWPSYDQEELDAASNVLQSGEVNYWTGQEARMFENEFAAFAGCNYGVAVSNGTVALEIILRSLFLAVGDEVIVTPRTFVASGSAIVNCGLTPVFVDVDLYSQNIALESVSTAITPRTKAIIAVHLAGWPCEMDAIMELASEHNLYVIEDCAQAHGALYKGRSVGSFGNAAAWSFCQDKIMTTGGEGGMVTTNDRELWSKMWSYKDHGKSWEAVYEREHPPGFRWLHESFGSNYRMTEMQAAIGRIQLRRMPEWNRARSENAAKICEAASSSGFRVPEVPSYIQHAWYKCYVFVEQEKLKSGWSRDRITKEINELGVPCYTGSCSEVYLEKCFVDAGLAPKKRLENAQRLGEESLMFLVHPTLTRGEIAKVCAVICEVGAKAFVS